MSLPNPLFNSNAAEEQPALFLVPVKEQRVSAWRVFLLVTLVLVIGVAIANRLGYLDLQERFVELAEIPAVQNAMDRAGAAGAELKQSLIRARRSGQPQSSQPAKGTERAQPNTERAGVGTGAEWQQDLAKRSAEWQQRMKTLESAQSPAAGAAPEQSPLQPLPAAPEIQTPPLAQQPGPQAEGNNARPAPAEAGSAGSSASPKPAAGAATAIDREARATQPVRAEEPAAAPVSPLAGARRIEFQIRQGRPTQIAPGVSFEVKRTIVRTQHFDADLRLSPQRTLKILRHRANEPLRLYELERPMELVITDVGEDFAVGYILVPR